MGSVSAAIIVPQTEGNSSCITSFEVTVKEGYSVESYAEGWMAASHYIQQAPGARGTRLHRKGQRSCHGTGNRHLGLQGQSRCDGSQSPGANGGDHRRATTVLSIFAFLGEYDDPDWIVLPPQYKGAGLEHLDAQ